MKARLHIGTSGWHYKHWLGNFYPPKLPPAKMFEWYARHFRTVELNNSFYRLPTEDAFLHWRSQAPPGFTFAVKASRFITHMKKLKDPHSSVEKFFQRALLLNEKLGPVLFQLPPGWPVNLDRLEEFLAVLPSGLRYVFEFRDESWHSESVYRILRRHNAALCVHDWRAAQGPAVITADFTYVRMHGPSGAYHGSYSNFQLENWASRIEGWGTSLAAIYLYFNNDQGGFAVRNAQTLQGFVGLRAAA
ncbi:MAG TPA: DUF72 domain-containing protein [Terriglobales bacterium]|nr:DUF72 domain-containing protein [Terriglobales bacterium]